MKVVLVSNFYLDNVDDKLLKNNLDLEEANKIARDYNYSRNKNLDYFAEVKEDNYNLYKFNS